MNDYGVKLLKRIHDIDMYDISECRESVAKERNMQVVYPSDNELQLDIDSEESYLIYRNIKDIFPKGMIGSCVEHPSSSGLPHRHITITMTSSFTELEKIALQFMFGSDRIRESLGILRHLLGVEHPSCFFEEKDKAGFKLKNRVK